MLLTTSIPLFAGPLVLALAGAVAVAGGLRPFQQGVSPRWWPVVATYAVGGVLVPLAGTALGVVGSSAQPWAMLMWTCMAVATLGGPIAAFLCAVQGFRPWAGMLMTLVGMAGALLCQLLA